MLEIESIDLIPCINGRIHNVVPGTSFCVQCGLIIKPAKKKKAIPKKKTVRVQVHSPKMVLPSEGGGLDKQMKRLIRKYGASAVEESFYISLQENGDPLIES